jgi:hypothetical protein
VSLLLVSRTFPSCDIPPSNHPTALSTTSLAHPPASPLTQAQSPSASSPPARQILLSLRSPHRMTARMRPEPHAVSSALITRWTCDGTGPHRRVRRGRLRTLYEKKSAIPDRRRQGQHRDTPRSFAAPRDQPVFSRIPRDARTRRRRHVCAVCAVYAAPAKTYSFDVLGWSKSRAIDAMPAVSRSRRRPVFAAGTLGKKLTARACSEILTGPARRRHEQRTPPHG